MSRPSLMVAGGVIALLSVVARAHEKPSAEYVDAMKTMNTIAEGLGKAVETYDFATIEKYVIAARPALDLVQKFWEAKKVEDAVQAAQDASAAIAELSVSATVRSDEGAEVAAKSLLDACARCHAAHREEVADGTFVIK